MNMLECLSFRLPLWPAAPLLLSLSGLATAAPPPRPAATQAGSSAAAEEPVKKCENAEAQLKLATELRNALRGLEGGERDAARARALAACRAVRQYFPGEGWACAEAAFRAGELLRAAGDLAGAAAEFQAAREQKGESPFRLRALLELGHMQRKDKQLERALASYEAALGDPGATPGQRDEASLWAGSVYRDLQRPADARRVWQRVADAGEDPLDRIRAFDRIASLLVETGDLEGAAGTIERCKEVLAGPAAEETRTGERVRSALQNMRAIEELQRAVERKQSGGEEKRTRKERGSKQGEGEGKRDGG
jgi:tetratricopeptide (TPR) repeat protein